ncbi:anti-sigma factor family protein [Paraburkholderia caffeinilytica]|uniref:anti-sigma factor family protein n=1 Tax=Paraburkholderia caffeinilytica TaxID=1761016 RepID=UPI0038B75A03
MKPDDIQLLAYVDGELPPHERDEIDQALRASPDLEQQVALLRASQLPYREAFARQKLPPMPDRLAKNIDAMAREAEQKRQQTKSSANGRGVPRPWIVAAAAYQRLYSRDTFDYVDADPDLSKKTLQAIRGEDGIALTIPDLRSTGLTFKRVQRLCFGDQAMVQIVYLPERSPPVALCVMREAGPDQAIAQQRVDGMNVLTWQQSELGYALIGKPGDDDLSAIAERIAGHRGDTLFGE